MTLMINVSPETARRLAEDPQALRRAGELVDAAFAAEDTELTPEDWEKVDEALAQVAAGKVRPHNRAEALAHAEELLKIAGLA